MKRLRRMWWRFTDAVQDFVDEVIEMIFLCAGAFTVILTLDIVLGFFRS